MFRNGVRFLQISYFNHDGVRQRIVLKTVEEIGVPDSQMSFVLMDPSFQIRPEWYVVTEDAEYVVKETPYTTGSYPTITCVLNLEDWATPYEVIQVTQTTIAAAVAQILPAGWSIGSSTVTKERNAGMMHVTALEALQKLCTAFSAARAFHPSVVLMLGLPSVRSAKS